ncbi:integrase core domain-containing protein [Streptomyces sp. NPDC051684]|uniref:integrase core domain-containing protein n=1 Tax=Streptomyces sp. NPDC051684 TaxID=3365670 RepID=UPI0037BB2C4B
MSRRLIAPDSCRARNRLNSSQRCGSKTTVSRPSAATPKPTTEESRHPPVTASTLVHSHPWKTLSEVELATAEWVDWYCHRRLHGEIGHVPPVEYETSYHLAATKPQVTTTI